MFDRKYPYTDIHELNLDWILTKIVDIENYVHDGIHEVIREDLDRIFIESAYESATETLIIKIKNPS